VSEATHGGKGDRSRVKNKETFDTNFDKIFKNQTRGEINEEEDKRILERLNVSLSKHLPKI
jgi:DNA-directed RNA polymerase subunit H (RpoH/RPB5)